MPRHKVGKAECEQPDATYICINDTKVVPEYFIGPELLAEYVENGYVVEADSLDDLAQQIDATWGIPTDQVVEALRKYNEACDVGVDPEFGKPKDFC